MSVQAPTSPADSGPNRRVSGLVAVVVAAVLLVVGGIWTMSALNPTYASALSIDNPTEQRVKVQVRGADSTGWMPVGTVPAGQTYSPDHVIDQGQTWTFRFSHREVAIERTYERDELEAQDWQVTVPAELTQRLREEGITPNDTSPFDEPSPSDAD